METRTKEAARYLGYGNHAVDDHTLLLIAESFKELDQMVEKKIIYRIFDMEEQGTDVVRIGKLQIASNSLARNLKRCERVALLGATLGICVDMQTKKLALTDIAKAVVMQACAAVLLEEYLEEWQERFRGEMEEQGWYLRPRFSPGYGDFPVEHQGMILRMLDTAKTIGLTMTRSSMLTPTKSVTAFIGLARVKEACHRQGCESCEKTDCLYRR